MSQYVKPVQKEIIDLLRKPLGEVIRYDHAGKSKIIELREATRKFITVGDTTTAKIVSYGVVPEVSVVDGFEKRSVASISISKLKSMMTALLDKKLIEYSCANKAGTLSLEALGVVFRALMSNAPVLIEVIGEEDLITLPLVAYAPIGSSILYGQPFQGIVVVRLDDQIQETAKHLMRRIGFDLKGV
jgi:uncharacterized protein (UPF0218 family)